MAFSNRGYLIRLIPGWWLRREEIAWRAGEFLLGRRDAFRRGAEAKGRNEQFYQGQRLNDDAKFNLHADLVVGHPGFTAVGGDNPAIDPGAGRGEQQNRFEEAHSATKGAADGTVRIAHSNGHRYGDLHGNIEESGREASGRNPGRHLGTGGSTQVAFNGSAGREGRRAAGSGDIEALKAEVGLDAEIIDLVDIDTDNLCGGWTLGGVIYHWAGAGDNGVILTIFLICLVLTNDGHFLFSSFL